MDTAKGFCVGMLVCAISMSPHILTKLEKEQQLELADTEILQLQEQNRNLQSQLDDWESIMVVCNHCDGLNGFTDSTMFTLNQLNLEQLGAIK